MLADDMTAFSSHRHPEPAQDRDRVCRTDRPGAEAADAHPRTQQAAAQANNGALRLTTLLDLPSKQIGQKGGGRHKLTGIIDLAMIQSPSSNR